MWIKEGSMDYKYDSIICKFCPCTDYGDSNVNTGPWNLCEGRFCEESLKDYNLENGANLKLDDVF